MTHALPILFGGWTALIILITGILIGTAWADSSREYAQDTQSEARSLLEPWRPTDLTQREYDPAILADALVRAHRRSGDERLLSVLYPDRPLERRATVVSLADRGRPFDWANPPEDAA